MIIKRKDGTFIIDHDGMPYHVVSREIDPDNIYDIDEIKAYAEKHPDEVQEEQKKEYSVDHQFYLDSTDWYIIRKLEKGTMIPEEVLQKREEARIELSKLKGATNVTNN